MPVCISRRILAEETHAVKMSYFHGLNYQYSTINNLIEKQQILVFYLVTRVKVRRPPQGLTGG